MISVMKVPVIFLVNMERMEETFLLHVIGPSLGLVR